MLSGWGASLITVVLADDVDDLRSLIQLQLELDGRFKVVGQARNGEEAITVTDDTQPDLVLMDLAMPVMDGLTAIPEVYRVAPETRVVVLSGFEDGSMRDRVLSLSAADYIQKGTSSPELADRLEQIHLSPRKGPGPQ